MIPSTKIVIYTSEMVENDVRIFANNSKVNAPYCSLDSWSKTGTTATVSHIYLITTTSESQIGSYSPKKLASKLIKPLTVDQRFQVSDFYLLADEAGLGENTPAQQLAKALVKCGFNQVVRVHAMAHPKIPGYIKPIGMSLCIAQNGNLSGHCHLNERSKLKEQNNNIELGELDRIHLLHDLEGLDRDYNTFTETGAMASLNPVVAASISLLLKWKTFNLKIDKTSSFDTIDSLLLLLYRNPELEIDSLIQNIQSMTEGVENQTAERKKEGLEIGCLKKLEYQIQDLHDMIVQGLIQEIESYKKIREEEPSRDKTPSLMRRKTFFVKEVKIRVAEKLLRSLKLERIEVITGEEQAPFLSGRLGDIIVKSGKSLEAIQSDCFRRQRRRDALQKAIEAEMTKNEVKSKKDRSSIFSSLFG